MIGKDNPIRIGAVIFEGFELLDVYGPLEMLGLLGARVEIALIGAAAGPIQSSQGPRSQVDRTFDDAGELDVLLVPGGIGTRAEVQNERLLQFLRDRCPTCKYVTSVCTGAALLAKAGLLDGRWATTNKKAFNWVANQGEHVNWVAQARWVEDDKFITSSGVTAGIDMSLALIEKLIDEETALKVAEMAEYEWSRDKDRDPFAKTAGLVG